MNIVKLKAKKVLDFELTPLINIVFLMLIFFLAAGSLKPVEVIDPVRALSGEVPSSPTPARTITLLRNGGLLLGDSPIDQKDLMDRLNVTDKSLEVLTIKPDAGLPAEDLVELMRLLRQGGFSSVRLLSIADSGKQ